MRRARPVTAVVLLAAVLLPGAVAPVLANTPGSSDQARIVAYWTPQRIANAKPRDFVRTPSGQFVPAKGKPGTGGGGTNVTGASWTKGGAVMTATGKVVFTLNSGDYICSGTTVTDGISGRSIVISAAHCAWDGADGGFARNWMFIPDFDAAPTYTCGSTIYGCFTASALVVNNGFTSAGGFNDQAVRYDWSFAVITDPGTKIASPELVGSFALDTTTMAVGALVYDFGYPAAGKYHGKDLTYCADQTFTDPGTSNLTIGIDCDMTGGSSGGPWLNPFTESNGTGTIHGVNSYGYSGVQKEYASNFNSHTQDTFNDAKTKTVNTITP